MSTEIRASDHRSEPPVELQVEVAGIIVRPVPGVYYEVSDTMSDATDTTYEAVLDDVLRRHAGAWTKLADM